MLTNLGRPDISAKLNSYMAVVTKLWSACSWGRALSSVPLRKIPDLPLSKMTAILLGPECSHILPWRGRRGPPWLWRNYDFPLLKWQAVPNLDMEPSTDGSQCLQQGCRLSIERLKTTIYQEMRQNLVLQPLGVVWVTVPVVYCLAHIVSQGQVNWGTS